MHKINDPDGLLYFAPLSCCFVHAFMGCEGCEVPAATSVRTYQRHVAVLQVRLHPPPALLLLPVRLHPSEAAVAIMPHHRTSQLIHRHAADPPGTPLPIQEGVAVCVGGRFLQGATPEACSPHDTTVFALTFSSPSLGGYTAATAFPLGPGARREELTSDPWLFFIRLSTLSRA